MTSRVFSLGSVIVDLTVHVDAVPRPGADALASAPQLAAGGGFNLMFAAARHGADVVYGGVIGDGPRGDLVDEAVRASGIGLGRPRGTVGSDTGLCITVVDAQAERTLLTSPGAEARLEIDLLDQLDVRPGDWVAISGYDLVYEHSRAALTDWLTALPHDVQVLLDPGPLVQDIPSSAWSAVLDVVDILSLNHDEALSLAGTASVADTVVTLHRRVRDRHPLRDEALLVIRRGANGCTVDGGPLFPPRELPTRHVHAVDTTGAGDTHVGVLLAELGAGTSTIDALLRANLAATISVTRHGPASAPYRHEVDLLLEETPLRSAAPAEQGL